MWRYTTKMLKIASCKLSISFLKLISTFNLTRSFYIITFVLRTDFPLETVSDICSPKMYPHTTFGNSASNNMRYATSTTFLELKPEVKILKLHRLNIFNPRIKCGIPTSSNISQLSLQRQYFSRIWHYGIKVILYWYICAKQLTL